MGNGTIDQLHVNSGSTFIGKVSGIDYKDTLLI